MAGLASAALLARGVRLLNYRYALATAMAVGSAARTRPAAGIGVTTACFAPAAVDAGGAAGERRYPLAVASRGRGTACAQCSGPLAGWRPQGHRAQVARQLCALHAFGLHRRESFGSDAGSCVVLALRETYSAAHGAAVSSSVLCGQRLCGGTSTAEVTQSGRVDSLYDCNGPQLFFASSAAASPQRAPAS